MRQVIDQSRQPPIRTSPLLPVAIGLMLGIFADSQLAPHFFATVAVFLVGLIVICIARGERSVLATGLVLMAAALGALRHDAAFRRFPANHLIQFTDADRSRLARLRGEIVSPIGIDPLDSEQPGPFATDSHTRFLLEADAVEITGGWFPTAGRVLVTVDSPALRIASGDRVELFGRLYRIRGPDNPGQFDWSLRRRRDGILLGLTSGNERNIHELAADHSRWPRMVSGLRRTLRRLLIDDTSVIDDSSASLLDAMILAQRGQVQRSIDDAFSRTGAVFFLCANGMHIAWLAWFIWLVCFACGAHYRTTAIISLIAILGYAIIAEANPPILRAVITASLFFVAQLIRRRRHTLNWISAAVIILLLLHPADLFNPGFQFSFAVVAGIILISPRLLARVGAPRTVEIGDAEIPLETRVADPRLQDLVRRLAFAPVVAFTAWLVGLPIAAYHFGSLAPWGWLNALVMSPLAMAVLLLSLVKLLVAHFLPSFGHLLAVPLEFTSSSLTHWAAWLAKIPGCNVNVAAPSGSFISAYYATLMVLARRNLSRPARLSAFATMLLLVVWLFIPWPRPTRNPGELRVWSLAVGDGAATILELPNGRTLAYDLGTRGAFDAARTIIVPFLRQRGIDHLDDVIISHPDFDHYGAVTNVAAAIPIRHVSLSPHFRHFAAPKSVAGRFLARLESSKISTSIIHAGDRLTDTGDVRIDCLWPTANPAEADLRKDNDTSVVLRISYEGRSILLTGDIADAGENALLQRSITQPRLLAADVLALPHHGSTSGRALPRFVEAVNPRITIRSTARRDADTADTLWPAIGARGYYSTAECGATCVVIRNHSIQIESFKPNKGQPRSN